MGRTHGCGAGWLVAAAVALAAPMHQAGAAKLVYEVTSLGSGQVMALSDSGRAVVAGAQSRGFVWTGSALQPLPVPKGKPTWGGDAQWLQSAAIDQRGDVAASYLSGLSALLHGGRLMPLPSLSGLTYPQVFDLSREGVVAGVCATGCTMADVVSHAVIWRNGKPSRLPEPPGTRQSWARRVVGTTVYGECDLAKQRWDDLVVRPAVWAGGKVKLLPLPAGCASARFVDANATGTVLGESGGRGWVWRGGGAPSALAKGFGRPRAMNSAGRIVGQMDASGGQAGGRYAVVGDLGGTPGDLNKLLSAKCKGWVLSEATHINAKGQIAGVGKAPNGESRAFLATPKKTG